MLLSKSRGALMGQIKAPVILVLLVSGIAISTLEAQVLYENSREYSLIRQNYRNTHSGNLFSKPSNPEAGFDKNSIRLSSSLQISNQIPVNSFFIQLFLYANKWSLYTEPWVVNEHYGSDLLGTEFTRLGLKGRYLQSFLKYGGENFTFRLGRFRQRWGQSFSNSLVFSLYSLPFDQASLEFELGEWTFDMFGGSFSSELIGDSVNINRHAAGHRIRRSFFDERLLLEAGEVIVYTGKNRNMDIQYLSPFSLYYIDMFDPTNYLSEDDELGDNENALMFFSVRWIQAQNLSFYSEFLLDDYQLHDTGVQNKLGLVLGVDGSYTIKGIPVSYEAEYTRLDSWTYLNNGQLTNFENLGHSAGYSYGPDNQSFRIQADGWMSKNLLIDVEYTYLEKGINTLMTVPGSENNNNTLKDSFPRPQVNYYNLAKLSLSWEMKYGRVEVGWSNIPFSNQIAYEGNPGIEGSFYLKLQGHYTFSGF